MINEISSLSLLRVTQNENMKFLELWLSRMTSYITFNFSLRNAKYCNLVSVDHTRKVRPFSTRRCLTRLFNVIMTVFPSATFVFKGDLWAHV